MIDMKRYWPVPQSYSKKVPKGVEHGAFGRKDFFINEKNKEVDIWHSGIDIFCPVGSRVIATEACEVVRVWRFTGAPDTPEYRKTWAVTVRNATGNIVVYGEVRKPRLKMGQNITAGRTIGFAAKVEYNRNEVSFRRCMLHFELYKAGTKKTIDWWYKGRPKPGRLLDPTTYLEGCSVRRGRAVALRP